MKLLVTGGAGYRRHRVRERFREQDHKVVVVDDLSTGNADAVPEGAEFVEADVAVAARRLLPDGGFDGVLHFAAKSLVGGIRAGSSAVLARKRLAKSLNLLQAVLAAGRPGRCSRPRRPPTGEPESVPITEDAPTRPTNAYGATKLAIDHAIAPYATAYGLAATEPAVLQRRRRLCGTG